MQPILTGAEVRAPGGQGGDREDFEAVQPRHVREDAKRVDLQSGINHVQV